MYFKLPKKKKKKGTSKEIGRLIGQDTTKAFIYETNMKE